MDMAVTLVAGEDVAHHRKDRTVASSRDFARDAAQMLVVRFCRQFRGEIFDNLKAVTSQCQAFRSVHGWPEFLAPQTGSENNQAFLARC